ncbi:hypothetical protein FOL46_009282, partial [Perkinsus olseni]
AAKFYAEGLDHGPSSTPWSIHSRLDADLVWYDSGTVMTLKRFGSLTIERPPMCFHSSPRSLLSSFGNELYARLHLEPPTSTKDHTQIIVCDTELGLIVGIKGNAPKRWTSTGYGVLLERQQSVDTAAVSAASGATESTDDHIHTTPLDKADHRIWKDDGIKLLCRAIIPAGTYKAIEVYGSVVSPPFPNLTDFEMLVTTAGSGSRARFTARGLDPASPDGQWSSSSHEVDLVWYSGDVVRMLGKLGLLEVDKARRCLHGQPEGAVNDFFKDLTVFLRPGRPPPGKLFTKLIVCLTAGGFVVGIGRNGLKHWYSSEYGFLLAPNPMLQPSWYDERQVVEPSKGAIPVSKRKRPPAPTASLSKRPKRDERTSARSLKDNPAHLGMSNITRPEQVSRSAGGSSILLMASSSVAHSPLPQVGVDGRVAVHENNNTDENKGLSIPPVVHEVRAKEFDDDHDGDGGLESIDDEDSSSHEDWLESLFGSPGAVFTSLPAEVMDVTPGFDGHHRETGDMPSTADLDEHELTGVFDIGAHQNTVPIMPSVDSRPPATHSPLPIDPTGVDGRHPRMGDNTPSVSSAIHEGAYETDDTGLDSVKEVVMYVETEPDTDRLWVKLIFSLCNYEEPLYFHDATAVQDDDHGGCLQLDLSGEGHSFTRYPRPSSMYSIRAQSIPLTSFRICGTARGSSCFLMFNRTDSIGQAGGLTTSTTIKMQLHRVSHS